MPTYVPLQSIVLATSATSVTFSNIDQTYQDLELVISAQGVSGSAQNLLFQLNGDAGAGTLYSSTWLSGDGSSATSSRLSNRSSAYFDIAGYPPIGSNFNSCTTSIQNYSSSTVYKTILARAGNAAAGTDAVVSLWRNTNAITSITLFFTSNSLAAGSTFDLYGISPVNAKVASASGGTDIFYDSTYVYHVFKGTGTFTPTRALSADILCVAGGGAGGSSAAGGGGAGGLLYFASQSLTANTSYAVTVGAGGTSAVDKRGTNGSNSQFGALTAAVGGGGGAGNQASQNPGSNGGSGGGAAIFASNNSAGSASPAGQGNNGGASTSSPSGCGGGGGGAGAAGGTGGGGDGVSTYSSWGLVTGTGENVSGTYWYAGGGGGSRQNTGSNAAPAGKGGGTAGAVDTAMAVNATTNTGGGGGGAWQQGSAVGGAGGSGIVIVRYVR